MQKEFDVSEMKAPASNVFNIGDPETYSCRVWDYAVGHSVLTIEVIRIRYPGLPDDLFFLEFDSVRYYEGPLTWQGAEFCTADLERYLNLLLKLQGSEALEEAELSEIYEGVLRIPGRLFEVQTANFSVKLIASFVTMLKSPLNGWHPPERK